MGDSVQKVVKRLHALNVAAIGSNCELGSDEMIGLMTELRQATDLPVFAKPNAGKPRLKNGMTVYPTTAEEFTHDIVLDIDGEDIHCIVKIIPTVFEDGQHAVALVMKDVTTQKIVEDALRMQKKRVKKRVSEK